MDTVLLREELDLLPGPVLPDGQYSWTIHDPQRNLFFRIDWLTFEILQRWSLGKSADIISSIEAATTLRPSTDDIVSVSRFLTDNQLVRTAGLASARDLAGRLAKMTSSPVKWLIHHYLFFRVPLVRPDSWLSHWLGFANIFYTRTFLLLTLFALVTGLIMVIRNSDAFFTTLVNTFNWDGLLSYGLAIILVKLLHELGHAFTAKRFGCRIPAMGIAFMVLWPMAYTDTNEAWRLTNRWQRFYISCAGIIVELTIAAWCTFMWVFFPDGNIKSAVFILATTSWVATLAINASPFMRFDGYFILCDMVDMPNLHQRSFALARWSLREWLFNLGEKKPESFSPNKQRVLIIFAWITWIYRLLVFLGIAILVYHFFIKIVGIMLFLVEIVWFIAIPVYKEILDWKQRWPSIISRSRSRQRGFRNLFIFCILILFLVIPWPGRVITSGILRPFEVMSVFAQTGSLMISASHNEGELLIAGTEIIRLQSPEIDARVKVLQSRINSLNSQSTSAGFSEDTRQRMQVMREELETALAELRSVEEDRARYTPVTSIEGTLFYADPDIREKQWFSAREKIATVVSSQHMYIESYLDEDAIKRIRKGDEGIFITDGLEGPVLNVIVNSIDVDATRILEDGMLSAQAGGHILTRQQDNKLVPERAVFRVTMELNSDASVYTGKVWRGSLIIRADAEAIATRFVRSIVNVLVRESGL